MIRASLLCLFLVSCTPSHPTPGGIAITGSAAQDVTAQERTDIDERIRRVRECFRANGFPISGKVKEVRVYATTCERPKFRHGISYVWGASNEHDKIMIERRLIEIEHEAAAVLFRDHGPLDHSDPTHPSMVCGEPLKDAWFAEHPRRPCTEDK